MKHKPLTWPIKLLLALLAGVFLSGSCFGAWGYLVGADSDMGELWQEAPVTDPATTAHEGRAEGVDYGNEADVDAGVDAGAGETP